MAARRLTRAFARQTVTGVGRLKRILRRAASWLFQLLVVSGALLTLFIALTPQGGAGFHTALYLTQVLDVPVKPQGWFMAEPLRHEVHFPSAGGTSVGQVYRLPDGKPRAAVLLSLGITDQGFADSYVINLGNALAKANFVVMYQWSPGLGISKRIDHAEPENLVSGFRFLERQDYVDHERVGLGGFSAGASFALVAAADDSIRDRVNFVSALGPHFDAEQLLLQAASRTVVYDGMPTEWEPEALTLMVIGNVLIETLDSPGDVEFLDGFVLNGMDAHPGELEALTPQGRTVAQLLRGVGPGEAAALYETLPSSFHAGLGGISPASYVQDIRARLLVMHDRNDPLVPAAESRRLVEASRDRVRVRHTELLAFEHTKPSRGGIRTVLGQAAQLYPHMYEIIRIAH